MKVADFDAAFPDRVWTYARGRYSAQTLMPATATHLAREALGLPTEDVPRETMLAAIAECVTERGLFTIDYKGDYANWRGLIVLCAAYLGDWDLVARASGSGKTLGTQIYGARLFRGDVEGFARHMATIVRAKAPAIKAVTAMNELRERFMLDKLAPDARVGAIAAGMFVRDLVVPQEDFAVVARRWLDGGEVELEPARKTTKAVADGEDPRIVIFERYAPELGDERAIDRDVAAVGATLEPWSRDVERVRGDLDDLAILAFVAHRPMFARWDQLVDPAVAGWLGAEVAPHHEERYRDLRLLRGYGRLKQERGFEDIVLGLAVGNYEKVIDSTGRDMPEFKPGVFFKDDARKLLRYLAKAVPAHATSADVEPAWFDFLARRSPATTPLVEGGRLRWKHLLALQVAITNVIGKRDRATAGVELRRAIAAAR